MLLEVLAIITFLVLLWLNRPKPVGAPQYAVPTFTSTSLASLLVGAKKNPEPVSNETQTDESLSYHNLPTVLEADYVVVGGGPGGLGAARTFCEHVNSDGSAPTVALLEIGDDVWRSQRGSIGAIWEHLTLKANLLQFASDLVGTSYDQQLTVARPLISNESVDSQSTTDEDKKASLAQGDADTKTVYPRGRGLGGTSILDWGLFFPSSVEVQPSSDKKKLCVDPLGKITFFRSPLSWAFAESAAAVVGAKQLSTVEQPSWPNSTYPGLLRTDNDGTRLPLPNYVLNPNTAFPFNDSTMLRTTAGSGLSIVSHCEVVSIISTKTNGLPSGGAFDATHLVCRVQTGPHSTGKLCLVRVKKSVVVAAGIIASPRILIASKLPKTGTVSPGDVCASDVIGLPMVFQAHQGISDDGVNVRGIGATLSWIFKRRGPLLNPIGDTLARKPVKGVDGAEVVLFMVPSGGRDPARYHARGMNRALGRFTEGFTIYILVVGVDGVKFKVESIGAHGDSVNPVSNRSDLSPETVAKLEKCFLFGMRLCYKMVVSAPLCKLTTEREAMDSLLLAQCEGGDASVALKVTRAISTPISKFTSAQRVEANRVLGWAYETVRKEEYMIKYIHAHTQWMGFGSGSCSTMLEQPDPKAVMKGKSASDQKLPFRVAGCSNVFVGDCSAVSAGHHLNPLSAGSVTTALTCGVSAALSASQI